jgi:hypothetical protein
VQLRPASRLLPLPGPSLLIGTQDVNKMLQAESSQAQQRSRRFRTHLSMASLIRPTTISSLTKAPLSIAFLAYYIA